MLAYMQGGGGCLLQEKIIASCAATFVLVADASKESDALGVAVLHVHTC